MENLQSHVYKPEHSKGRTQQQTKANESRNGKQVPSQRH